MSPQAATLIFYIGILVLFALDRGRDQPSKALWIPTLWLLINSSRPVSAWLEAGPTIDSPEKYLDGSPIDAAFFGVLLIAGVTALASRKQAVAAILKSNTPLVLFFLYCGVSVLWSDFPFVAFKRWIKATGDVVMILVVLTEANRRAALERLLLRIGFLLVPLSILLIKYYPNLGRSYNRWTWEPMYTGVTTFKNLLGMTCLICGLGSLWRFLNVYRNERGAQRIRRLIAHGVMLAMVVWLFEMANSMTSLSCFMMAGSVMISTAFMYKARRPAVVHLMLICVVSLAAFALFSGSGGGLVQSIGRDPTLTGRTEIWRVVISQSGNSLLGTGFESYWLGDRMQRVWDMTTKGLQEAHNGYIEVWLNLGWIGVLLLAALMVKGYGNALRVLREQPDIGTLNLSFFVVGVIYSFTEAGYRMMAPVWIAFLISVIRVPKLRPSTESPMASISRPRERKTRVCATAASISGDRV